MPSLERPGDPRGLAFVAGSPLLLPGLGGCADPLADLRATCRQAITALGPGRLVVLGAGRTSGAYDTATPLPGWAPAAGWGPDGFAHRAGVSNARSGARSDHHASARPLPASLAVGLCLAERAELAVAVADDDDVSPQLPAGAGLVVVGDGSACRGPRAPLPDDRRGEAYDAAIAAALASGDPAALLGLDRPLGVELGVSGLAPWRTAARLAQPGPWRAQLLADEAPLGVAYAIATWLPGNLTRPW